MCALPPDVAGRTLLSDIAATRESLSFEYVAPRTIRARVSSAAAKEKLFLEVFYTVRVGGFIFNIVFTIEETGELNAEVCNHPFRSFHPFHLGRSSCFVCP